MTCCNNSVIHTYTYPQVHMSIALQLRMPPSNCWLLLTSFHVLRRGGKGWNNCHWYSGAFRRAVIIRFLRKLQGAELRHSKHVLPNPKKRSKQHYRILVTQNAWIRANLLDALGNYKYCSACIINTSGIGSQWLVHQRSIKQRETLTPLVHMSKLM